MRRAEWYVIQVKTGRERKACEVVRRACEDAEVTGDEDLGDKIPRDKTPQVVTPQAEPPRDATPQAEPPRDATPQVVTPQAEPPRAEAPAATPAHKPPQKTRPTSEHLLEECFSPTYEYRRKLRGEWVRQEMLLLPGYVIAVTRDPWALARVLRATPEFTRLLAMGTQFVPLSANDRSWMERWTTEDDRTIPMSVAYKEGDAVVVTDGPLVGQEAMIVRVNRRKRVAHLEIHAGQLTIHTTVGLEVLPKPEGEPASME